jgi:signal peptidase I
MKKVIIYTALLILVFLLGWTANSNDQNLATGAVTGNWIEKEDIEVYQKKVCFALQNATITSYANTSSMRPTLNELTHGIEIQPIKEELKVGDIVAYKPDGSSDIIVHRIVAIENEEYILRGDNNAENDPQKVRFNQIEGVVVGLIY